MAGHSHIQCKELWLHLLYREHSQACCIALKYDLLPSFPCLPLPHTHILKHCCLLPARKALEIKEVTLPLWSIQSVCIHATIIQRRGQPVKTSKKDQPNHAICNIRIQSIRTFLDEYMLWCKIATGIHIHTYITYTMHTERHHAHTRTRTHILKQVIQTYKYTSTALTSDDKQPLHSPTTAVSLPAT